MPSPTKQTQAHRRAPASGEILTPELFPRADGTTWVCAISTVGPLPVDPADVAGDEVRTRGSKHCVGISRRRLPRRRLKRGRRGFRPVTEDGLPFIGGS